MKTVKLETVPTIERRYKGLSSEEIGFEIESDIGFVVRHSLCHGCGTCEAICPEAAIQMQFEDRRGIYLPQLEKSDCTECGLCVEACSGFELDLTERSWGDPDLHQHPFVGPHLSLYRSYSNDSARRERAASGGVVTEIVDYLLDSGKIDGAILVRMNEQEPMVAEAYIAYCAEDLIPSQKSKYCPVPLNTILRNVIYGEEEKRYAFVGLPHHVHGLRYVQRLFPHVLDRVPYVLSTFTAHVPSQRATDFILYKKKLSPREVKKVEYRGGGHPGRMRLLLKDDSELLVPHLDWIYSGHSFPLFFYPVREWLYFDKMSEWADFSCGDNWMKGRAEQEGASTVVTRSRQAELVINELIANKRISSTHMEAEDLMRDQHLVTKLNVGKRLTVWKLLGRKVPLYERRFDKDIGSYFRTSRFALNVLISEWHVPMPLMNCIIATDYHVRVKSMRLLTKVTRALKSLVGIFRRYSGELPARNARYKVVLIGGYGFKDIGDESMPHAVRLSLRKELGDELDLVMLSHNPKVTQELHGERSCRDFTDISFSQGSSLTKKAATCFLSLVLVFAAWLEARGIRLRLWPSARGALNEIATADLVFNVGGGNVNSITTSEIYKKCTTYWIASILGKPVFVSGQTMGPYYNWFDKWYVKFCVNKVTMISFRDKDVSRSRLHELGVSGPVMFDAADDAITLEGVDRSIAESFLARETGVHFADLKNDLVIFLNLKASLSLFKGKGRDRSANNEIALMAKITDALREKYDCAVVFLATDYSPNADDRVLHDAVFEQVENKQKVYTVDGEYTDVELIGMIDCADVVIGGRYHFNVFAASICKPFLGFSSGLYQMTKLEGLANLCGQPDCFVSRDMEFAKFEEVWPSICKVIDTREAISEALQNRVGELKGASRKVVKEAVSTLLGASDSQVR